MRDRDLSTAIARAVMDRIEADKLCNSDNIGDAVFRELAVAAANPTAVNRTEQTVVISYRDAAEFVELLRRNNAPLPVMKEAHRLILGGVRL